MTQTEDIKSPGNVAKRHCFHRLVGWLFTRRWPTCRTCGRPMEGRGFTPMVEYFECPKCCYDHGREKRQADGLIGRMLGRSPNNKLSNSGEQPTTE